MMAAIIIVAIAVLLIAYAVYGTVQKARGKSKSSCCGGPETIRKERVEDTDKSHYPYKYIVSIDGMMCSQCALRVENAFNATGSMWAKVNLGKHSAEVLTKNEMKQEDFAAALGELDYTVTSAEPAQR